MEVIKIGLNIGYLTSDKEDSELYTLAFAVDSIKNIFQRTKNLVSILYGTTDYFKIFAEE